MRYIYSVVFVVTSYDLWQRAIATSQRVWPSVRFAFFMYWIVTAMLWRHYLVFYFRKHIAWLKVASCRLTRITRIGQYASVSRVMSRDQNQC